MAEVAALSLQADSKGIRDATVALREIAPAATAAEKAAQRWGMSTDAAARSADDFSRRVQGTIKQLEFERAQLTRTAAEQAKYTALRRAGVSASSAEGQAIAASVAALQAQRAAVDTSTKAMTGSQAAAKAGAAVYGSLKTTVLGLAAAFSIDAIISKVTAALREVADLDEVAGQIGITVKGLQALQFQAVQNNVSLDGLNTGIGKFSENIGKAAEGDKSMIESLQGLKVKILDVHGNLLPTEDLLVQVAQRITAMDDPARKTAAAVDLFGKAGKQMIPLLAEIAKGFDSMSARAKAAGVMISDEAIAKLDKLDDSAAKSHLVMRAFFAENLAGPLTDTLDFIAKKMANVSALIRNASSDLTTLLAMAANPGGTIAGAIFGKSTTEKLGSDIEAKRKEIGQFQDALKRGDLAPRRVASVNQRMGQAQAALDALERQQGVLSVSGKAPASLPGDPDNMGVVVNRPPRGVNDPTIKGGGGAKTDPFKTAVESAKDYIALKNAETAAVGLSAEAAARMKHEQELVNKATNDNIKLGPAQRAELEALAAGMAKADAAFKTANFMNDANKDAANFIADQQLVAQTLWMSEEAAAALRFEQEMLNKAVNDNIVLTPQQTEKLRENAAAMASIQAKTKAAKDEMDFAKDTAKGFFSDMNRGLREGASVWETFGNAVNNVLGKISDKLMSMAVDQLFESAFGGAKTGGGAAAGGGGGFMSGITSWISSLFGSANGNAFNHGNVIPFARGGVVAGPTIFPMANGMGLMGEAGPEAVMPLRRGPDGKLGVAAGGGGGGQSGRIDIYVHENGELLRLEIDNRSAANIKRAGPAIVNQATTQSRREVVSVMNAHKAEREGDWRTM